MNWTDMLWAAVTEQVAALADRIAPAPWGAAALGFLVSTVLDALLLWWLA